MEHLDDAEPVAQPRPEPLDVAVLGLLVAFVLLAAVGGAFVAFGQTRHAVGCWVTSAACLVAVVVLSIGNE